MIAGDQADGMGAPEIVSQRQQPPHHRQVREVGRGTRRWRTRWRCRRCRAGQEQAGQRSQPTRAADHDLDVQSRRRLADVAPKWVSSVKGAASDSTASTGTAAIHWAPSRVAITS